jgi:hypothetical protein
MTLQEEEQADLTRIFTTSFQFESRLADLFRQATALYLNFVDALPVIL